jgi:hypothetical protein
MTSFWLMGEDDEPRKSFDVGESILIAGRGLRPTRLYECSLEPFRAPAGPRGNAPLGRLVTDRHGTLHPFLLLPYFGLLDVDSDGRVEYRTLDEAERAVGGQTLAVRVTAKGNTRPTATLSFGVAQQGKRPRAIVSDASGRLVTGFVRGEADVSVAFRNVPPGCIKAILVPRQFRWRVGDPIDPVSGSTGEPIIATGRVPEDGRLVLRLWRRDEVRAGSYQIIARAFVPGWFEADADYLLPSDIVPHGRMSSLVVRWPPDGRIFQNGVVLTPEITGHPLTHAPYFQFVNNFPQGTDVWAAIDPDALPSGLVSQRAAIYVIAHKTAAQWQSD